MKVLIDTNILISAALSSGGTPFLAYVKAVSQPNHAVVCEQNLDELRRVGHIPRIVKTWKDTELDIKSGREEILAFCSNEYPMHCFYLELYCILHFIVTGNLFSALCASLILRLF